MVSIPTNTIMAAVTTATHLCTHDTYICVRVERFLRVYMV